MEHRVLERLAAGEPVKVSTLRTATAASLPVLAALVRKKWIARETAAAERDARRTERFAVLIPGGAAALADGEAAGDSGGAGGVRRRACRWPSCGAKELPSSTLQTLVRRGLVRIEERAAAFRLGGIEAGERRRCELNESQTEALASIASARWGHSIRFCCMA